MPAGGLLQVGLFPSLKGIDRDFRGERKRLFYHLSSCCESASEPFPAACCGELQCSSIRSWRVGSAQLDEEVTVKPDEMQEKAMQIFGEGLR